MPCHKYVVTAQKPTATHFSAKGAFTAPNDVNLVLGKGTRVEIYTSTADGLKPTLEFGIYGTIACLLLYKPRDRDKDSLFVLTTRRKYCILTYSENTQQVVTEASGEIGLPGHPRLESVDVLGIVDPTRQYFAASIYESIVTIIMPEHHIKHLDNPANTRRSSLRSKEGRKRQDYMNLCLVDKKIVSMAFLEEMDEPTLMILYDDSLFHRHLQLYTIDLDAGELVAGEIVMDHLETDANILIAMPSPVGGIILLASKYIRYFKQNRPAKTIGITSSTVNSYSIMNEVGSRILVGDEEGQLHLLMLNILNNNVDSLCFIDLGQTSIPSCLSYLGNDIVFVGSTRSDSQLVHMRSVGMSDDENDDILKVIEEFPNLAPITDFCFADLDKQGQGQGQLITCSGAAQGSSLRIIRNGVGLNEVAAIDISGVKGIWALRPSFHEKYNDMLVISFVNQTHLLQIKGNEMKQLSNHSNFALDQRTLATANVADDLILQVTQNSIRLMESKIEGHLLDEWFPDNQAPITVTSVNPTQCVVSTGYGHLVALEVREGRLVLVGRTQLEHEISCLDINPTDRLQPNSSAVVAVGVWQQAGVLLLALPTLEVIAKEPLGGTVMPRSILMTTFEDVCYLLVALGDGQFYNFRLDGLEGRLWDKKRSFPSKLPITLAMFTSNGTTHVFAASDKPSVIHSRNQKLIYSNVNLKEVRCVTSFNSAAFPDAVALTTRDRLIIGQMEEIQKLHITKIPTRDTPRRIVLQESTRTLGIVTEKLPLTPHTAQTIMGGFEILDTQTFSVLDRVYFKHFERPMSAASILFENDPTEYYAVSTGQVNDAFEARSLGRILLLRVTSERKLTIVNQVVTNGVVELIRPFKGKLLASFQSQLHVFNWQQERGDRGQLVNICSRPVPSITESVAIYDDIVVTGDMMYSTVAFRYNDKERKLEELASEEIRREITALEALSTSLCIGAEKEGRLLLMERRNASKGDNEPLISTVSQWHLGEHVHRFRFGSLGTTSPDPDSKPTTPSLIFVTASGAIGVIADLSEERFKLLWQMQYNMTRVVQSIGGLSHADWRCSSTMNAKDESANFIDGDLIESFLDLTPQQMQEVVEGRYKGKKLDLKVEDLCNIVEELMSVHS